VAAVRAILTYHSLDASGSVISVEPSVFAAQMEWLARHSVRVVTIAELMRASDDENAVAVTFDDAFQNFADCAAPVLARHGFPATVFVVSDRVGATNRWRSAGDRGIPELPLMHWNTLRDLAATGGVTLGAHTRTHPRLNRMGPSDAADEVLGSADSIRANTGCVVTDFAYPYGAISPGAVAAARSVFRFACTTELRMVRPNDDPLLLPRLDMYYFRREMSLDAWLAPGFPYRLGLRSFARRVRGGVLSFAGDS
jgi:peptidoglycan/xylan/chitin deacetylase (PgdA/CDA1 family)